MANLHLCIGFYPNGSFKCNTISDEHLQDNIEHNKLWRPGRFYFVDGEYVCGGVFKEPKQSQLIEQFKNKIKEMHLKPDPVESETFY